MTTDPNATPNAKPGVPVNSPVNGAAPKPATPLGSGRPSATLDEMAERLQQAERASAGGGDDLEDFIKRNWQKFAGAAALVLLFVVLVGEYRKFHRANAGSAAEQLTTAREMLVPELSRGLGNPAAPADGAASKSHTAALERLQALAKEKEDSEYGNLALLYLAEADVQRGDAASAEKRLDTFNVERFRGVATAQKPRRATLDSLVEELACLLKARIMIVENRPQGDIREYLKGMVLGADVVASEALLLLAKVSVDKESRDQTQEVLRLALLERPQLITPLKVELGRFGFQLE